jgi:hypothetical protein
LINGAIVAEVGDFARFENARQTPSIWAVARQLEPQTTD